MLLHLTSLPDSVLLIELYGIETTFDTDSVSMVYDLLIELYGIETSSNYPTRLWRQTFNRTIWN